MKNEFLVINNSLRLITRGYRLVKANQTLHKFALGEFLWVTVTWAGEESHTEQRQACPCVFQTISRRNLRKPLIAI